MTPYGGMLTVQELAAALGEAGLIAIVANQGEPWDLKYIGPVQLEPSRAADCYLEACCLQRAQAFSRCP